MYAGFLRSEGDAVNLQKVVDLVNTDAKVFDLQVAMSFVEEHCSAIMNTLTLFESQEPLAPVVYVKLESIKLALQIGTIGPKTQELLSKLGPSEARTLATRMKKLLKDALTKLKKHLDTNPMMLIYKVVVISIICLAFSSFLRPVQPSIPGRT